MGLVTADGRTEHYVEIDLASDVGQMRRWAASDFLRYGALDQWDRVPGAQMSAVKMGQRTAVWLLDQAAASGSCIEVGYDDPIDFELIEEAIRDTGLWRKWRKAVRPICLGAFTETNDAKWSTRPSAPTCVGEGSGRRMRWWVPMCSRRLTA